MNALSKVASAAIATMVMVNGPVAAFAEGEGALIVYVSPTGAGDRDGRNWENAMGDIAAAVNAASGGDVVQLAPGTYVLSATVTISDSVTVQGLFADCTKITASGTNYSLFNLTHAGAVLAKVTLTGATASTGAGVKVTAGTVQDAVITQNKATAGGNAGAGVWLNGAGCCLRRCRVEKNAATGYGGGVYAKGSAVIESCSISGNKASWGGGIYCDSSSSVTIAQCSLQGNTGTAADLYDYTAGNVRYLNCTMSVDRMGSGKKTGCVVTSVQTAANLAGKGVSLADETMLDGLDLSGAVFSSSAPSAGCTEFAPEGLRVNWTSAEIGAYGTEAVATFVYENRTDEMTIETALYDPSGAKVGGSETGEDFTFTVTDVIGGYTLITTVTESGEAHELFQTPFTGGLGEIHVSLGGTGTFPYNTVETAFNDIQSAIDACMPGGVVVVHDGTYEIMATVCVEKSLKLKSENGRDSTVLERDSNSGARLLYINHAEAQVEGFTIRGGKGGGNAGGTNIGGGVLIGKAGGTLDKCLIENCATSTCGGGMALLATNAVVRRTIFRNNSVPTAGVCYGGGIYVPSGGGVVDNCLFYGNEAYYGGAIYSDGTGPTIRITNTTALDNRGAGGNICDYSSTHNVTAINTISTFVNVRQDHCLGSTAFADQPNRDYSLAIGATAIDAGVVYEGMCETDLVGNPRVSGEGVDIGAYERSAEALTVDVAVDVAKADFTGDVIYTLTPSVTGTQTATLDWSIRRGDGVVVRTETGLPIGPLAFRPTEPGCYSVRVVASDGDRTAEKDRSELFVAGADRVFIDAKGGNVYPYATAANASTNFNLAWSMVGSTAVVTVAEGTYDVRRCLSLSSPVRLVGAGSDKTVLKSSAEVNDRLVVIDHPEASVTGCALTGVRMGLPSGRHGSCVYFGAKGGLVEDCTITNNAGNSSNGAICFPSGSRGVLRRCTVGDNTGGNWGGSVYVASPDGLIDDCLLRSSSARYGQGVYVDDAANMTNCTVVGDVFLDGKWPEGHFVNCYIATRTIQKGTDRETTFSHCASANVSLTNGVGNIKVDPCFVDSANSDYHLTKHSPLRKAGLVTPQLKELKDRDGISRVSNGVVDIGCYQLSNSGLVIFLW